VKPALAAKASARQQHPLPLSGLVNYASSDCAQLAGLPASQIAATLGWRGCAPGAGGGALEKALGRALAQLAHTARSNPPTPPSTPLRIASSAPCRLCTCVLMSAALWRGVRLHHRHQVRRHHRARAHAASGPLGGRAGRVALSCLRPSLVAPSLVVLEDELEE
jgi:hypothetical protein